MVHFFAKDATFDNHQLNNPTIIYLSVYFWFMTMQERTNIVSWPDTSKKIICHLADGALSNMLVATNQLFTKW